MLCFVYIIFSSNVCLCYWNILGIWNLSWLHLLNGDRWPCFSCCSYCTSWKLVDGWVTCALAVILHLISPCVRMLYILQYTAGTLHHDASRSTCKDRFVYYNIQHNFQLITISGEENISPKTNISSMATVISIIVSVCPCCLGDIGCFN